MLDFRFQTLDLRRGNFIVCRNHCSLEHPHFGTEYIYDDTETTATNKIKEVKNRLNGAVKSDYAYTYDNRGNILTVSKSGVMFQQYVYDEANQLKTEYNYAEGTAMTYVYDANGNIVSKTPYTNVTSSDLTTATQGAVISYGYGDTNWSDKLTSYNGQTISYDDSGNPTSYKGDTITWNGRLMTSYTKGNRRYEYSYNSDGMRTVKKIYENNELIYTYLYIWDGDVLLASRFSPADSEEPTYVRYLYDESGELYGMDYNGAGFFGFIKNLQGDIVSIVPLDSQSDGEVNIEYDAWGKPIFEQTSSGSEALIMAMIIAATNVAYRSYFYDFDTELYYLRSRYYDPEIGRFINADDVEFLGYSCTSLGMNLFAYCENNPVNCVDYSGNYYTVISSNANINSMVNSAKNLAIKSGMIRITYLNQTRFVKGKGFVDYKLPTKAYSKYIQQYNGKILYLIYTRSDGVGTYEKPFFETATVHQWNSYIVKKYANKIDKARREIRKHIGNYFKKHNLNINWKAYDRFLDDVDDYINFTGTDNKLLTTAAFAYELINFVIGVIDYIQTHWWSKQDRYIYNTIKPYVTKKNWNTRIMILMCKYNYRYYCGRWQYDSTSFPY